MSITDTYVYYTKYDNFLLMFITIMFLSTIELLLKGLLNVFNVGFNKKKKKVGLNDIRVHVSRAQINIKQPLNLEYV